MNNKFNPLDWLNNTPADPSSRPATAIPSGESIIDQPVHQPKTIGMADQSIPDNGQSSIVNKPVRPPADKSTDVENILSLLESSRTDLTANYADWRDIGFAFADAFGEQGRGYYHRVSRFYPGYTQADCDKQYDACLKSHGHGINLKTFFHLAKQAGIPITSPVPVPSSFPMPAPVPENSLSLSKGAAGSLSRLVASSLRQSNRASEFNIKSDEDLSPSAQSVSASISNITSIEAISPPHLPESIYNDLPLFLKEICDAGTTSDEKDLLLLGSVVTLSSCIPNIFGYYHNRKVCANLYLFVTAHASAGKGILTHCSRLVYPVQKQLLAENQQLKARYDLEYNEYLSIRKKNPAAEKPERPPVKMLFIPANNSASGVFQLLHDNQGRGLIFETEGDTMAYAFKSDYGNYSDGFRKAFHHETIRYYRKTDREFVNIEQPCLSAVLSGTPRQIQNLIPDTENGLFSRFIFYYLEIDSEWKDVFERKSENGLDDYFDRYASQFFDLFRSLNNNTEIEFTLEPGQQTKFNATFAAWQSRYEELLGLEYNATVRRLGLITFRMAMIFSVLRVMESGNLVNPLICEERDFQNALSITEVLIQHAQKVFAELMQTSLVPKQENRQERFFANLPDTFTRKEYLEVATCLGIPDKTAQGYITRLIAKNLLSRDKQNLYAKSIPPT